jgi:regulator of cell morphogenesis and NO signaling
MATMTTDWNQASLGELAQHIIAAHHSLCRKQMAELAEEITAIAADPAHRTPLIATLKAGFQRFSTTLTSHLVKEETVLFPLIARIETAWRTGAPPPTPSFGSVANPIRMMILEHDEAERALEHMRGASNDFQPADNAGARVQELCRALRAFDADLARHVELEDTCLFPRAVAIEKEAADRS